MQIPSFNGPRLGAGARDQLIIVKCAVVHRLVVVPSSSIDRYLPL